MRRRWNTNGQRGAAAARRPGHFATLTGRCACDNPECVDFEARLDDWPGFDLDSVASTTNASTSAGGNPEAESSVNPSNSSHPSPTGEDGEADSGNSGKTTVDKPPVPGGATKASSAGSGKRARLLPQQPKKAKQKGREAGPRPGRCAFFLEKKNRYCSMRPAPGKQYCGVHESEALSASIGADSASSVGVRRRIPCPFDPRHTIFEDDIQRHSKVCVSRMQREAAEAKPYFEYGLNSGRESTTTDSTASISAAPQLSLRDPVEFAHRVDALFAEHVGGIKVQHLSKAELDALLVQAKAEGLQHNNYRHRVQQASILCHMRQRGLMPKSANIGPESSKLQVFGRNKAPIYVEFGAGRGMLSLALRGAMPEAAIILVDRDSSRHKADHELRKTAEGARSFERLRIDIRHLNLASAPLVRQAKGHIEDLQQQAHDIAVSVESDADSSCSRRVGVVGVSKHLCGVATDLTLRCLRNSSGVEMRGVAIALCCHHVCTWADYVGQEFFHRIGLGPVDFDALRAATSWCVEAAGPKAGLNADERARTGRQCKRLIDGALHTMIKIG